MIYPVFSRVLMFCGKALEMIIAKKGLGVLQNKGRWFCFKEGTILKGVVWRRFLRVVRILLKKGDLAK